ncbi:Stress-response A/B barrel domain-containing protein [Trichoderma simmonsii]|uniref:Stress-response A/B barrel domain-containing protein n=1 Tax=Trichoderma simmonsii TaxID=1491479 RepID=A0A8G0LE03_9HYPO|nr:Stress-response A/B barrel domain-containing protein [Trichoderma simmonsii]
MVESKRLYRITLFKIPSTDDQKKLLDIYAEMPTKAVKDSKPYILSVTAGPARPDQRAQGYTVAVFSVFASLDDMLYYDNECAAHASLKSVAKTLHQGALMVYYESIFDN